ncbi:MAG: hypothetical protein ACMG6H_14370, partial [Acidobacteriota bacterium]
MIDVACKCGEIFRADETQIGYSIRCRKCHRIIPVAKEVSWTPPRWYKILKKLQRLFSKKSKRSGNKRERIASTASRSPIVVSASDEVRFAKLKRQIDKLAKDAWKSRESLTSELLLNPSKLPIDSNKAIETILNHVRQIASGLSVPNRVPRVETGSLIDAGGQFKVSDGWVSVKIANYLLMDRQAVRAILAHEICHYVLENSGIREEDHEQNERLTDLCMFVCGLGDLFLGGYKRESIHNEYRPGHRLGYLTDAEYGFASKYVLELRTNNSLQLPTRLEE